MQYDEWRDPATGKLHVKIEIDSLELVVAPFDCWDRRLLRECDASDSVADKLLALEMIARRLEEHYKRLEEERNEIQGADKAG